MPFMRRGLTRKFLLKSRRIKPAAAAKQEAKSAEIVIDNDNDIDDGVDDDVIKEDTVDDDDTDLINITKSDDEEENLDGDPDIVKTFLDYGEDEEK